MNSARIQNKDILNCLPLIASVLGQRYGVAVYIGGGSAYTDGKNIHIPSLPQACDTRLINMARGYIDHESAHIRYTNFELLEKEKPSALEKYIWNCIEDWRVEKALGEHYPGCRSNFAWLIKELFLKELFLKSNEQAVEISTASLLHWILHSIRSWDVPELQGVCEQEALAIEPNYPGLLAKIHVELDRVRAQCASTADALESARKIVEIIKNSASNIMEKDEKNYVDAGSSLDPLQQLVEADAPTFKALASASLGAWGEMLSEQLQEGRALNDEQEISVAGEGKATLFALPEDDIQKILHACRTLKIKLNALLQARTLKRCLPGRRGKVNGSLLHRSASNNPCVFLRGAERQGLNTAVHILLDKSGSMQRRMDLACAACHALTSALQAVPGVNVGLTLFPVLAFQSALYGVAPLLRHGERRQIPPFSVQAEHSTPLAESLWWLMQQMLPLRESRKILFIITDGDPDSLPAAKLALAKAASLGIEVLGLGIRTKSIHALIPASGTIDDINKLPATMFSMLRQAFMPT